ncbi:hypothetical protein [Spiroplasma endosymbiont of Amphibalanus improvisus]|uniref:hypothetical protein n=1 Tax=Spiroplasma endosymbiont of Amphibalanus improvisus TaxID=3066327 RepID=UPI00313C1AF9
MQENINNKNNIQNEENLEKKILNINPESDYYKKMMESSNSLFKKAQSTLDVAQYNASKIIYEAVDMAYEVKNSIIELLSDIKDNKNNLNNIIFIIENFVKTNEEIFVSNKNILEISESLTNKIIKKINNN